MSICDLRFAICDCASGDGGIGVGVLNGKSQMANGKCSLRLLSLAAVCLLVGRGAVEAGRDWSWELPAARYRKLNVFQRAQYDKAAALLRQGSHKAAASEFEKFRVQFPDAPVLSYVLFMRGYCLHQAKFRNKAIKVYQEVLDYFADEISDAAPALYFMGSAHIENGETRQGMECMREMVGDEDYRRHPLAAGALQQLAENCLKNRQTAQAIAFWKQIVRDFEKTNRAEAGKARQKVTVCYVKSKDYKGLEAWLLTDEDRDNAQRRKWLARRALDTGRQLFAWHARHHYGRFEQKEKTAAMKACFDYFQASKVWFQRTDSLWEYHQAAITFVSHCYRDKRTRDKLIDDAVALAKTFADKKGANDAFAWLADRLRDAKDYLRARHCIGLIDDPPRAAFMEYQLFTHQHKWKPAVRILEQIEKMGKADWVTRALTERANIYREHLGKYDEAIKLYHQLSKPPWTLWQIQDCYIRWGKLQEAIRTLTEIENSFPDQAPSAAWHKARYYHEAREPKKAIAQARKILKAYKKSKESSQAHQLLEEYGVATGGGVFREE